MSEPSRSVMSRWRTGMRLRVVKKKKENVDRLTSQGCSVRDDRPAPPYLHAQLPVLACPPLPACQITMTQGMTLGVCLSPLLSFLHRELLYPCGMLTSVSCCKDLYQTDSYTFRGFGACRRGACGA